MSIGKSSDGRNCAKPIDFAKVRDVGRELISLRTEIQGLVRLTFEERRSLYAKIDSARRKIGDLLQLKLI